MDDDRRPNSYRRGEPPTSAARQDDPEEGYLIPFYLTHQRACEARRREQERLSSSSDNAQVSASTSAQSRRSRNTVSEELITEETQRGQEDRDSLEKQRIEMERRGREYDTEVSSPERSPDMEEYYRKRRRTVHWKDDSDDDDVVVERSPEPMSSSSAARGPRRSALKRNTPKGREEDPKRSGQGRRSRRDEQQKPIERRGLNRKKVEIEDDDEDVVVIETPTRTTPQNSARKKREEGRNRAGPSRATYESDDDEVLSDNDPLEGPSNRLEPRKRSGLKRKPVTTDDEDDDVIEIPNGPCRVTHESDDDEVMSTNSMPEDEISNRDPMEGTSNQAIVLSDTEEVAEKIKKQRRRLPKQRDPLNIGTRRHKMRRSVHQIYNRPRPVLYRMTPLTIKEQNIRYQKRTRVTRKIYSHRVAHFHKPIDAETDFVPDASIAETVQEYLAASKPYYPLSTNFHDVCIAVSIEYDDSTKVLHFGRTMKKNSCRQKRLKFQLAWWPRHRKVLTKKRQRIHFRRGFQILYKIRDDPHLYQCHWNFYPTRYSPLQLLVKPILAQTMSRRDDDDIIRDSTYFCREFFVPKAQINFRLTRSADVPWMFVPPILDCGYFPLNAITVENKKAYLAARYSESQMEYLSLAYRDIPPKPGFKTSRITETELYNFHLIGKHIHGFWLVWELEGAPCTNTRNTMRNKRYLVDMFHYQFFPLDVEYKKWEYRLKIAFDLVSTYNLQLAEIVRVNRPIFDHLSQNPSFLKPISLSEIVALMREKGISPKFYAASCGYPAFYEWGVTKCNEDYLSAHLIISGGSKQIKSNDEYDLRSTRAFPMDKDYNTVIARHGSVYNTELQLDATTVCTNVRTDQVAVERRVPRPMTDEEMAITNMITDTPCETSTGKMVLQKKPSRKEILMTRDELIEFRRITYNLPIPPIMKKRKQRRARQRPGRKPETKVDKAMKKHDFNTEFIASDVESEYEGYLSGSEDVRGDYPKLRRSQSAESFFVEPTYTDYFLDHISVVHQMRFHPPETSLAKTRRRKMNRLVQKHSLNYCIVTRENNSYNEMMLCYENKYPRLSKEVAQTKKAIRTNSYAKCKVPRVFTMGDAKRIDIVASVVKDLVSNVVGLEHLNERAANVITRFTQKARVNRQNILDELKDTTTCELPSPGHLSLEILTRKRILGSVNFELAKSELQDQMDNQYYAYMSLTPLERHGRMLDEKSEREVVAFDMLWNYEDQRERQLDRTPKYLKLNKKSIQAQQRREEARRETRRKHAAIEAEEKKKRKELEEKSKDKDVLAEWEAQILREKRIAEEKLQQKQNDLNEKEAAKRREEERRLREQQRKEEAKRMAHELAMCKERQMQANSIQPSGSESQKKDAAAEREKQQAEKAKISNPGWERRRAEKEAILKREIQEAERIKRMQKEAALRETEEEAARKAAKEKQEKEKEAAPKTADGQKSQERAEAPTESEKKKQEKEQSARREHEEKVRREMERRKLEVQRRAEVEEMNRKQKALSEKRIEEGTSKTREKEEAARQAEKKRKESEALLKHQEEAEKRKRQSTERKKTLDLDLEFDDNGRTSSGPFSPEQVRQERMIQEKVVEEMVHQYEKGEKKILAQCIKEFVEQRKDDLGAVNKPWERKKKAGNWVSKLTPAEVQSVEEIVDVEDEEVDDGEVGGIDEDLQYDSPAEREDLEIIIDDDDDDNSAPTIEFESTRVPALVKGSRKRELERQLKEQEEEEERRRKEAEKKEKAKKQAEEEQARIIQERPREESPSENDDTQQNSSSGNTCPDLQTLLKEPLYINLIDSYEQLGHIRHFAKRTLKDPMDVMVNYMEEAANILKNILHASSESFKLYIDKFFEKDRPVPTNIQEKCFDEFAKYFFFCRMTSEWIFKTDELTLKKVEEYARELQCVLSTFTKQKSVSSKPANDDVGVAPQPGSTIKEPEITNNSSVALGTPNTPQFKLVGSPCNDFWKFVEQFAKSKSNFSRRFYENSIQILVRKPICCKESGAQWTVGVFTAACCLLTGYAYKSSDDHEFPFRSSSDKIIIDNGDEDLKSALKCLVDASVMFDQAYKSPSDMENLFKFDGFSLVMKSIVQMCKHIIALYVKLDLDQIFKNEIDDEIRISELFGAIRKKFEHLFPDMILGVSKSGVEKWRDDDVIVGDHCLNLEDININNYPANRKSRVTTFQVLVDWIKVLMNQHTEVVENMRKEVLEDFTSRNHSQSETIVEEASRDRSQSEPSKEPSSGPVATSSQTPAQPSDETSERNPQSESNVTCFLENLDVRGQATPHARLVYGVNYEREPLGTVYPVRSFARVSATFRVMSETEKRAIRAVYRRERKLRLEAEKARFYKLSPQHNEFVNRLFRAMENELMRLPCWKESHYKTKPPHPHVSDAKYSFSLAMRDPKNEGNWPEVETWETLVPVARPYTEINKKAILKSFSNEVVSRENFRKLQWAVRRRDGSTKQAIEYFTDLAKYHDKKLYASQLSSGMLPFKFKVFKLLWFLGDLVPRGFDDAHHDYTKTHRLCGGCTNGDVILVHNCSCIYHKDENEDRFIYTEAKLPEKFYKLQRLVGRFVCEHGPSSVVVLTKKIKTPPLYNYVPESRHTQNFAKVVIVAKKTMHNQLLETFDEFVPIGYREANFSSAEETNSLMDSSGDSDREKSPTPDIDEEVVAQLSKIPEFQQLLRKNRPKICPENISLFESQAIFECQWRKTQFQGLEVPENRKWRSKSLDHRDRALEIPTSLKTDSLINLVDLEKYALSKIERVRTSVVRELMNKQKSGEKMSWDTEELINELFNEEEYTSDKDQARIIAEIFKSGSDEVQCDERFEKRFKELTDGLAYWSLPLIQGDHFDELPTPTFDRYGNLIGGYPISPVMDDYLSFMDYGKTLVRRAKRRVSDNRQIECDPHFDELRRIHNRVFNVNVHLLEHLIHRISQATFTTFAMYQAERTKDMKPIRKVISKAKSILPTILNSYVNAEPLKRQLSELQQILDKYPHDAQKMDQYVSGLGRYAIERIRVPRCADKIFEEHVWVNNDSEYANTIDLLRINVNETRGSFDLMEFLVASDQKYYNNREIIMRSINLNPENISATRTLLNAFWFQSAELFMRVKLMLPKKKMDRRMKTYYECQSFMRILRLVTGKTLMTHDDVQSLNEIDASMVYSAIISNPIKETNPEADLAALTQMYIELCKHKATSLPIPPSYIGTTFVCLEAELVVAMVVEKHIYLDRKKRKITRPVFQGRRMELDMGEIKISMLLDTRKNEFLLELRTDKDAERGDRLQFELPFEIMYHSDPFQFAAHFVRNQLGRLHRQLSALPRRPRNRFPRLGWSETPFVEIEETDSSSSDSSSSEGRDGSDSD